MGIRRDHYDAASGLTFRTLFRTAEAILAEPLVETSRAGSSSPAIRPVRALRRGVAPGGAGRLGPALMVRAPRGGRRQARAPAGVEWHGVGGRDRWKRPFDFPILQERAMAGGRRFIPYTRSIYLI
jgi:hypothetical protein